MGNFSDLNLDEYWINNPSYDSEYADEPLTEEKIQLCEQSLGYKLPAAYIDFMQHKNGGALRLNRHTTATSTSWSMNSVAITGLFSIGITAECSLCGEVGSQFMIDEWGYPPIGIYFADCPSAGHDMICLDYRNCGPGGEPQVVHVDQEAGYKITSLADNFSTFVRGLWMEEI